MHRYTEQPTIALDVFIRDRGAVQRVAIDLEVAGDCPLASLADEAQAAFAETASRSTRDPLEPSNVAVTFVADDTEGGGSFEACALADAKSRHDANFVVVATEHGVHLALVYNAGLITASAAARLVRSAAVLLAAGSEGGITVNRLPLLDAAELRALTADQDSGTVTAPSIPVHRVFEAMAKARPSATAMTFRGKPLTYAELDQRSNRLALRLVAMGVGPEVPVAVCVGPSLEVLVAMLAIWKSRGVYLPLDPTHPEALIHSMLEEAQPRVVLTTAALSGLSSTFAQIRLDDGILAQGDGSVPPATEPKLSDSAYLLYTSGTTGKPKGVLAKHANLTQYIHSATRKYGFREDDLFVSLARHTFSISMFELVSPLCCGASVRILERDEILSPDRLLRALDGVTVIHAGPSLLGSLFRHVAASPGEPATLPRVRHASSGGDIVSPSVMSGMERLFPSAELFVIYGCTEVSCMGTTYAIPRGATTKRTFVGKPFPNVAVRVVDASRRVVPFGVVGEIAFAGDGVVPGYLRRPELTAERFVAIDGRVFYLTGDMGRLHPDGNLEMLGRRDFQVQLRGIRIELAGVEKTVLELGLATQCVIVARTVGDADVRLVAFVVSPAEGGVSGFRRALAAQLPDYMVPHQVVVLDAMPLTANGKVDRNRLKEMQVEPRAPAAVTAAPATALEKAMAAAFARVLGVGRDHVGVNDGFFDLGGDSLLAVVALDEIARSTGVTIPPHVLFECGTVRALAQRISGGDSGPPRPVPLGHADAGPPLFMLSGVHVYRPLAERLEGLCTPYGVYVRSEVDGFLTAERGLPSVEEMAQQYIESIRACQPQGPYRMVGYSFGGIIAYEVAQRLREAGQEVSLLALVDPQLPEWIRPWMFRLAQIGRLRDARARDLVSFVARRLHITPPAAQSLYRRHDRFGPLEERMDAHKRASAAAYMPNIRPFSGDVTLFVAGARLRDDPLKSASCGWDAYVQSLSIHPVDADHFAMMSEPAHVAQIAEVIAKQLALPERRSGVQGVNDEPTGLDMSA